MFAKAVSIASGPTRPLVLSGRTSRGECRSTISAHVVLNAEGWTLTAGHPLEIVRRQQERVRRHRGYRDNVVEFQRDITPDKRFRKRGVRSIRRPDAVFVSRYSVWWGTDNVRLVEAKVLPAADLALGRPNPFDSTTVAHYPVLEDPTRNCTPGRSLCKLGYPFQQTVSAYDEEANTFTPPPGSVSLAPFPLEGMFTRVVNTCVPGSGKGETNSFIETSTPGLIGQSGVFR